MNIFKKIFGKKVTEEKAVEVNNEKVIEKEETLDQSEESVEEEVKVESECQTEPEYVEFTEDDKNNIAEILRPFMKALNDDAEYKEICVKVENFKQIKTFVKLSEDKLSMFIKLTASDLFNTQIGVEFTAGYVLGKVFDLINADGRKYDVYFYGNDSSLMVKKIK